MAIFCRCGCFSFTCPKIALSALKYLSQLRAKILSTLLNKTRTDYLQVHATHFYDIDIHLADFLFTPSHVFQL